MNIKCPNCRYKFEITPPPEGGSIKCACPRCSKTFTAQLVDAEMERSSAPVQHVAHSMNERPPTTVSQESEMELYYALMNRIETGQHEEAGTYLARLLELNPDEPMYLKIKDDLDKIKQSYFLATKYLQAGKLNLAKLYINDLLQLAPNHPMYLNLKERYDQAHKMEAQRQKGLHKQETNGGTNDVKHNNNSSESGCMVVILAIIFSLAFIIVL